MRENKGRLQPPFSLAIVCLAGEPCAANTTARRGSRSRSPDLPSSDLLFERGSMQGKKGCLHRRLALRAFVAGHVTRRIGRCGLVRSVVHVLMGGIDSHKKTPAVPASHDGGLRARWCPPEGGGGHTQDPWHSSQGWRLVA